MSSTFTKICATAILILTVSWSCVNEKELTPDEVKTIAEEAYIYAYPMLENYKMMFSMSIWVESPFFEAPPNTLKNKSVLLGPEYTAIVRPNNDTFYSSAMLDLRSDPVVFSVPAIPDKRYYSIQLIDLYTHNFGYIGSRETGFDTGDYLIAGPGWQGEKPDGIDKIIHTECNLVIALGRTQVFGAEDADNAKKIMDGFKVQPLSAFLEQEKPKKEKNLNFPSYDEALVKSAGFIEYLNFLLGQTHPHTSEAKLLEQFSRIGIGPNQPFDADDLDPALKKAIEQGIENAIEKISAETQKLGSRKNGWMQSSDVFGSRETMQGRYLTRAAAAMFGLYGNSLEEAFYPETSVDQSGEALNGAKHSYVLHFDKAEIPPVKGFWSLSMYKLPEQWFIENPINRYVISSDTKGLQYNPDGSLDLYIQKDSPGKDKESNWLPAHDGLFSLQARLYWPSAEMLDPLYVLPAVQKRK